ncbi:hypothetical protein ACJX0J_032221 [Zea mays]
MSLQICDDLHVFNYKCLAVLWIGHLFAEQVQKGNRTNTHLNNAICLQQSPIYTKLSMQSKTKQALTIDMEALDVHQSIFLLGLLYVIVDREYINCRGFFDRLERGIRTNYSSTPNFQLMVQRYKKN